MTVDPEEFVYWINENFVAVFLVLLGVFAFLIWTIKYWLDRRNASLRNLKRAWKALTADATLITDRLTMRVCPIGGDEFDLQGSWYLVDSFTERHQVRLIDDQGKVVKAANLRLVDHNNKVIEKPLGEIASKTETAVVLDKRRRRVCGVRYTDLKPNSSFLAETGYLALSEFDPRRSKMVLYSIIGVLCLIEVLLWWLILAQIEPTFLVDQPMWGIYGMIAMSLGFTVYLVKKIFGFYTLVRSVQTTDEAITFVTGRGKDLSLAYQVHQVETHWFPGCRIENVLGLDTEKLAAKLNGDNQRMVSKLSSRLQTMEARLNFALTDLNEKALELDTMAAALQVIESRGYLKGREDEHVPFHDREVRQWSFNASETLRVLMPLVFLLIILGAGAFFVKFLADTIHLDSLQTTLLIGALVICALAAAGLILKAVLEATRRPAVG